MEEASEETQTTDKEKTEITEWDEQQIAQIWLDILKQEEERSCEQSEHLDNVIEMLTLPPALTADDKTPLPITFPLAEWMLPEPLTIPDPILEDEYNPDFWMQAWEIYSGLREEMPARDMGISG